MLKHVSQDLESFSFYMIIKLKSALNGYPDLTIRIMSIQNYSSQVCFLKTYLDLIQDSS